VTGDFRVVLLVGVPLSKPKSEFMEKLVQNREISLVGVIAQSSAGIPLLRRLRGTIRRRGLFSIVLILGYFKSLIAGLFQKGSLKDIRYFERNYNIPVFYTANINSDEVVARIKVWQPDLGVIYGTGLVKPRVLDLPGKGMIGIHHGKLPEYKGPYTTAFWPLYHGERETGITIQQVNAGIDTGDMLLQKIIPIGPKDNISSLTEKANRIGVETLIEAILSVKSNTVRPVVQEKKGYTYTVPTLRQWLCFQIKMLLRKLKRGTL